MKNKDLKDESEIESLIKDIDSHLKKCVCQKRYEHSVRTAEMCGLLCARYGLDRRVGWLCGIAHDICKEFPDEKMIELAEQDGKPITPLEREKVSLLHGRAAAVFIRQKFGICDESVLEAVAKHTFAAASLGDYGKLLFVADKIEPGRPQSTEEYRNALLKKTLDGITLSVLDENISYLEKRGKTVAEDSYILREQLREKIGIEGGDEK